MRKYILFAAKHMNWGTICSGRGDWLSTSYVVYSDGSCWSMTKYDGKDGDFLLKKTPAVELQCTSKMDAASFDRLSDLLESYFDRAEADFGCDGSGWKMYHYGKNGNLLHSISGYIGGERLLAEIGELLRSC